MSGKNKKALIRRIEVYLRHYRQYKVAIKNLQKQLDYIMPAMTANYELREGSTGTFSISSPTEKYAIDRIESKRALDIHEQIRRFQMLIDAVDEALVELTDLERKFVDLRYMKEWSIKKTGEELGYSDQYLFVIRQQAMDKLIISLGGILEFF